MGRAIGIHLGENYTIAAVKEAEVCVLQNRESADLTRSVVGEYRNQKLIGQLALDRHLIAPKGTIQFIRRLMGRSFRDVHVQQLKQRVPYQIVELNDGTEDDVRVLVGGSQYSPIEISSMILKKVKEDAEMRLNDTVEYAVITVPAYFTEKQKDATRKAGQLAGLKVQKILEEPTAAAIAFGVDNVGPDDSKTILVYDLGGGTFDVSVMTIVGGSFVTLDIEGDMWLGGDDFDRKIMDHVLQHVSTVYGVDGESDAQFMVELKKKAEQAKKALSSMTRTDIIIPGPLKDSDGNLIAVELEISRSDFDAMIAKDVARSIDLVRAAIKNSGEAMTPDQIDHVLLVGGSSYIPMVQSALAEMFGREKLLMNVDPIKCVAYGAAIAAERSVGMVECPEGHMTRGDTLYCLVCGSQLALPADLNERGVTPMHYGIEAEGGRFEIVIPKGTKLPTPEPVKIRLRAPSIKPRQLRIPLYAGFSPTATNNDLQGTLCVELPDNVLAETSFEVSFGLDEDGILTGFRAELPNSAGTNIVAYLDRGVGRPKGGV